MSVFDTCNGTLLVDATGFASLEEGEVAIDKNVRSAAVDANLEIFDFQSGNNVPLAIHLRWYAVERPTVARELVMGHSSTFKVSLDTRFKEALSTIAGLITIGDLSIEAAPTWFASVRTDFSTSSFHEDLP